MTHVWYWRACGRKGEACRLWARGRNGNVGVEFADGHRIVAPRYCVRRLA